MQCAIAEFGKLREEWQAVDFSNSSHEAVAGDTVRYLVLGEFRVTGIVPSQFAHNLATDEFIEGNAVKLDHDAKCLRMRNVQLS